MVAGRKRTPTAVRLAEGTLRMDRHGNPDAEPGNAIRGTLEAPVDMGDAGRKVWETLVPQIAAAGYLTELDLQAFTRLCLLHDEVAECEAAITEDGAYQTTDKGTIVQHPAVNRRLRVLDMIKRYESDFWLNPTSRAGKQVAPKTKAGIATRKRSG